MPVNVRNVIQWSVKRADVREAERVSALKHPINDTFIRGRGLREKYEASRMGDIAKISFKQYLLTKGLPVIDWDDPGVRPNWQTQRKRFDLQVNNHNIEVRSSISQYDNIADVLLNEHIIHPPRVNFKEINIQVFFTNARLTELWFFGWALGIDMNHQRNFTVRYQGNRKIPFYMMRFDDNNAQTIAQLISFL